VNTAPAPCPNRPTRAARLALVTVVATAAVLLSACGPAAGPNPRPAAAGDANGTPAAGTPAVPTAAVPAPARGTAHAPPVATPPSAGHGRPAAPAARTHQAHADAHRALADRDVATPEGDLR